jgi:hypothetical protein
MTISKKKRRSGTIAASPKDRTIKSREAISASMFQQLYDSEINFGVSCFWDAGFDVRLGDAVNGFLAQDKVPTWEAVEKWLHYAALKFYPNSGYAKHVLGDAWRATNDQVMPISEREPRSERQPRDGS